jgi:ADP-heptose:LPS heptosyltransferase
MSVIEGKSPADVARVVLKHGAWATGELVRGGRPRHVLHFYGRSPGDDLMCTSVLHEMRRRGYRSVWMMSRFPELFEGNPDVDRVVPHDERYDRYVRWMGGRSWYVHYGGHDHERDQSPIPTQHILAKMCASCELTGEVTLRPYLHLSDEERAAGRIAPRQIVLHSSGLSAHSAMLNKEWVSGRMQQVANALRGEYTIVQLGATSDPKLDGCVDLRGRTTMRRSAAIIANSVLVVAQAGFLMHLTRAVDRPAVIIYGGREAPWQTGYSCNTNLFTSLPCSPCWRWNGCDNPVVRECMQHISVDDVVRAVHERAARADEPLAEDRGVIAVRAD